MMAVPHFILSLVLTACISFSAPIILVGVIFTALFAVGYFPGLTEFGPMAIDRIVNFLKTFGAGNPIQGIITIGLACGLVGSLFDLFNLYCDRSLSDDTKCSTESDWASSRLRDCAQRTDGANR
jgi:hypothetical protein